VCYRGMAEVEGKETSMESLRALGACRPLLVFFALAFGLSWGNVLLGVAWPSVPFLFPYGPLLAALIVAGATRGTGGERLHSRPEGRLSNAAIRPPARASAARGLLGTVSSSSPPWRARSPAATRRGRGWSTPRT
jgi:hypothetical protein